MNKLILEDKIKGKYFILTSEQRLIIVYEILKLICVKERKRSSF